MSKKKWYLMKLTYLLGTVFLCIQFLCLLQEEQRLEIKSMQQKIVHMISEEILFSCAPILMFMEQPQDNILAEYTLHQILPFASYLQESQVQEDWKESNLFYELTKEGVIAIPKESQEDEGQEAFTELTKEQESAVFIQETQQPEVEEAAAQIQEQQETMGGQMDFTNLVPTMNYTKEQLSNPQFVQDTFFTVDPTTRILASRLTYDKLMGYDASIQKRTDENPQILIYHTHSQEGFCDSIPQDASTTVVGVGEKLTQILKNQYGYQVLHHVGEYDKESRDYAYTYAAKGLQQVLEENPSIEVIIDLHRDAVKEGTKLVTQIGTQQVAKFMFFNGMSYTNTVGELASLPNPYIQDNLSFAFQLKVAADEYFPDLTRKTYLKGYRYNMQYRAKSLLIEVGAQTNTVKEAMQVCEPLAFLLNLVLSGQNK